MSENRLKDVNMVDINPGASLVNATDGVENTNVPNPIHSGFETRNPNPSNSTTPNSTEATSSEMGDQDFSNIRPISSSFNLKAVDINGQPKTMRTTLNELWTVVPEDQILVTPSSESQPIEEETQLLSAFLGKLARNGQKCPIHYERWHDVPDKVKQDLLNFIETRFCLQIPTKNVLRSLGKKWRDYKHDLYNQCDDSTVIPSRVVKWQYEELVAFWYSDKEKAWEEKVERLLQEELVEFLERLDEMNEEWTLMEAECARLEAERVRIEAECARMEAERTRIKAEHAQCRAFILQAVTKLKPFMRSKSQDPI